MTNETEVYNPSTADALALTEALPKLAEVMLILTGHVSGQTSDALERLYEQLTHDVNTNKIQLGHKPS